MNVDHGHLPPKFNKRKTNNSDGGGHGTTSSTKKRENVESATIVTQSSTDQHGKADLTPNSGYLVVSEKTNFKKRGNVESSSRCEKDRGKLRASAHLTQSKKMKKGKDKEDNNVHSKKAKLTISEERQICSQLQKWLIFLSWNGDCRRL